MALMGPYLEIDRQIAGLAARQHGVVRHDQLRTLGLSQKAIRHRRAAAAWNLRGGGAAVLDVTVRARSAVPRDGTRLHLTTRPLETTKIDLLRVRVVRFTHRQVVDRPDGVAATLAALLIG